METSLYNNIVTAIRDFKGLTHNCINKLEEEFPKVNADTLYSLLNHEYQRRMRSSYGRTQNSRNKYWDLYRNAVNSNDSSGILLKLAETYDIPPCLLARLILQKYFDEQEGKMDSKETTVNIHNYLKNTSLIPDATLAYEVFLCTMFDNLYSPFADCMRMSLGQQYEVKLYKEAVQLGLAFRDECYLRKCGYDKTPDLKLEVPVSIDGFIINWIESKALFADPEVHKDYIKNQYSSYWNRFGPGLVIYWFGYLESIVDGADKRFIIRDHLPKDIRRLLAVNQS